MQHLFAEPVHHRRDPLIAQAHSTDEHVGEEQRGAQQHEQRPDILNADGPRKVEAKRVDFQQRIERVVGQIASDQGSRRASLRLQLGKELKQGQIGLVFAVFGRVGHVDAGADRALVGSRIDTEQVTAGIPCVELAHVSSRRDLAESQVERFAKLRPDGRSVDVQEVQKIVVLVQRIHDNPHFAVADIRAGGKLVLLVHRPHGPADHLSEQLVVVLPFRPTVGPTLAGVGGQDNRASLLVSPGRQHRRVARIGRLGRNHGDFDQRVVLDGCQHHAGDRGQRTINTLQDIVAVVDFRRDGRREFLDQWTGDAARLLLIDFRQSLGVGDDIVAAASGRRDVLERRTARWSVRSDGDRRDLDLRVLVRLNRGLSRRSRIAVADDDHVFDGRLHAVESS